MHKKGGGMFSIFVQIAQIRRAALETNIQELKNSISRTQKSVQESKNSTKPCENLHSREKSVII